MHKVIDSAFDISDYAAEIKASGVDTVIRYYNHQNSRNLPSKRLEVHEALEHTYAGLSLCTVFQQGGGAKGRIEQLDAEHGKRDAARALKLASDLGQPKGSAIYFSVDHDYWKPNELKKITPYFKEIANAIKDNYRVGVYGSGKVGRMMRDAGYAELIWLAAARGWSGSEDVLETDEWALYQHHPSLSFDGKFSYDGNTVGAKWKDFGQFRLTGGAGAELGPSANLNTALSRHVEIAKVIAASGLNLRRGPGQHYPSEGAQPSGTYVLILARNGEWAQVDINGDGTADGFMHGDFLRVVSGGFPLPRPANPTPYDIAKAELVRNIVEVPGSGDNPRIALYHRSTNLWSGDKDGTAWCSSFVNYCVEQAGYEGTNHQRARSWESWGQDVTTDPQEGDIVVFSRGTGPKNGHVGFFVVSSGEKIKVLGGNQSSRIQYSDYPKNGNLGGTAYKLLSIRRP